MEGTLNLNAITERNKRYASYTRNFMTKKIAIVTHCRNMSYSVLLPAVIFIIVIYSYGTHGKALGDNKNNSNMNYKFQYKIANPTQKTPISMPFHGEYFEMLGPEVTTKYSEVFWHTQPINLPDYIIKRFDNIC